MRQISSRAVIILEKSSFLKTLPEGVRAFYENGDTAALDGFPSLRIIPASTVNGNGLLLGYMPASVKINGVEKDAVIVMCYVCFDNKAALVPQILCTLNQKGMR